MDEEVNDRNKPTDHRHGAQLVISVAHRAAEGGGIVGTGIFFHGNAHAVTIQPHNVDGHTAVMNDHGAGLCGFALGDRHIIFAFHKLPRRNVAAEVGSAAVVGKNGNVLTVHKQSHSCAGNDGIVGIAYDVGRNQIVVTATVFAGVGLQFLNTPPSLVGFVSGSFISAP